MARLFLLQCSFTIVGIRTCDMTAVFLSGISERFTEARQSTTLKRQVLRQMRCGCLYTWPL